MFLYFLGIISCIVLAYVIAFSMVISPRKRIEMLHKSPDELAEIERANSHDDHH